MQDEIVDVRKTRKVSRDHVSFSEISLFDACQWRWFLDVIDGRKSKTDSVDLVFGDSMHKSLESGKSRGVSKRTGIDETCALFESLFVDRAATFVDEQARSKLVASAKNIISRIDSVPLLKDGRVMFNELELMVPIDRNDGLDVKFKGFIDVGIVVEARKKKTLWIADYKTAKYGWFGAKRFDSHVHSQLLLYKHFFCKSHGMSPKDVRTAFVILKKEPKDVEQTIELFPISAGPKALEAAVDRLQETVTDMHSGCYVAKASACFPGYGGSCPYVGTDLCPVGKIATK